MKHIVYLLALLFLLTSCKKEYIPQHTFIKITFDNRIQNPINIKHEGTSNLFGGSVLDSLTTSEGEGRFEVYSLATGALLLDTVLNVEKGQKYYVYQAPGTTTAVFQTNEPPAPPVIVPEQPPIDPDNPLANEPAAPEGFMKIKVANLAQTAFPYQAMDIVFNTSIADPVSAEQVLKPLFTIKGAGPDFSSAFQVVERPVIDGVPVISYIITYVDPATGESIRSVDGNIVRNRRALSLSVNGFNNFMINITQQLLAAPQDDAVISGVEYYFIAPRIAFQN